MNGIERVQRALQEHLIQLFSLSPEDTRACIVSLNVDESKQQFGDLNTNAAMVLARPLKGAPRAIAEQIAQTFSHEYIERIEIAGPGFINLFLTHAAFCTLAQQIAQQKEQFFTLPDDTPQQNVSIEFVSANPTGPLHFGHGRGGIIGDVLGNILRLLGHTVTKEFYINDAGSQIQKLGHSLKIRCQQVLGQDIEMIEDGYQGEYLIDVARMCVEEHGDSTLKQDDLFFQAYGKQKMLERIKETLNTYGIYFDVWFSEKTLHEDGSITAVLKQLEQEGHIYEDDGALWFRSSNFGDDKDRVVRKKTGELTYVAADIAYLKNKIDRGADHLIMTLGHDHHGYVQRLQGVKKALGLESIPLDVILYQLVKIKESGKQLRMSKRTGTMVTLHDVVDTVGTDVARFFYLNRKADAQLEFDLDLALKRTDENPVYYVQYAYVRTGSILERAQAHADLKNITPEDAQHLQEDERFLLKKIAFLRELLASIAYNNQTHLLAYYAVELCQTFSRYYTHHRVVVPEHVAQSRGRLLLVTIMRNTLATVFDLLGISKPERM